MAEPPSTAASVAGFVGLADVALRAGKELYTFFSALKDAPREIKQLSAELEDVSDILSEVDAFSSEYAKSPFAANGGPKLGSLLKTLRTMQDEVRSLDRILKPMESNTSQTRVKKLVNRLQWVSLKEKLERYNWELSRHNAMLRLTLSLCGRRNDLHIHRTIGVVQQGVSDLHTSTGEHYQALDTRLETATKQASRDSQRTLSAMRSLKAVNRRGFQAAEASALSTIGTITRSTQELHTDNITAQKFAETVSETTSVKLESIIKTSCILT